MRKALGCKQMDRISPRKARQPITQDERRAALGCEPLPAKALGEGDRALRHADGCRLTTTAQRSLLHLAEILPLR